ncbi:MAG: phosphocholine cytidylyltransferase family protein [Bacteroidales bacterium]|nr:phosphocholine cytidylyltransferase family protein [Bacteroidales bacterium]
MNTTAVILAAGTASRLRPLTDTTPKCLLLIDNKSILERTIDNILANGINKLIIVTGYREEMIQGFANSNYPDLDIRFITNNVYESTNNAWSLMLALRELNGGNMLLLDSDILFDADIIKKLLHSGYRDCLALRASNQLGTEEIKVVSDSTGLMSAISKVVNPADASGESIGIELFSEATISILKQTIEKRMAEGKINEFYEASFEEMIQNHTPFYAVNINPSACMEIDTVEDLQTATKIMQKVT